MYLRESVEKVQRTHRLISDTPTVFGDANLLLNMTSIFFLTILVLLDDVAFLVSTEDN